MPTAGFKERSTYASLLAGWARIKIEIILQF